MTGVEQTAERGAAGSEQSASDQAKERVQETAEQMGQKAQEVRGQAGDRVRQELDLRSTQAGGQVSTTGPRSVGSARSCVRTAIRASPSTPIRWRSASSVWG